MLFSKLFDLRRWGAITIILVLSLALTACGDAADSSNNSLSNNGSSNNGTSDTLEITGTYDNNFGGTETIAEESWTMEFPDSDPVVQALAEYDNDANYAVTQNPADAEYSPSKFNKNVWTEPDGDGSFYYCTVAFGEDSAEAAANTDQTADDSDPANGGCGGAPWTLLTPQ